MGPWSRGAAPERRWISRSSWCDSSWGTARAPTSKPLSSVPEAAGFLENLSCIARGSGLPYSSSSIFEPEDVESAKRRLDLVRERIQRAALRRGRNPNVVTLIAVPRNMLDDRLLALAELGRPVFGEDGVQEAGRQLTE